MNRTTFLFSEPSFFEGVARLIDFGGTLNVFNESKSSGVADKKALSNDWYSIGDDVREVLANYEL